MFNFIVELHVNSLTHAMDFEQNPETQHTLFCPNIIKYHDVFISHYRYIVTLPGSSFHYLLYFDLFLLILMNGTAT